MPSFDPNYHFKRLNHADEYRCWKVRMKDTLILHELWKYASTSAEEDDDDDEWVKKDARALAHIRMNVGTKYLAYLQYHTTSREAWQALEELLGPPQAGGGGGLATLQAFDVLTRNKFVEGTDMRDHVLGMQIVRAELQEARVDISDALFSDALVHSLPNSGIYAAIANNLCVANNPAETPRKLIEDYYANCIEVGGNTGQASEGVGPEGA